MAPKYIEFNQIIKFEHILNENKREYNLRFNCQIKVNETIPQIKELIIRIINWSIETIDYNNVSSESLVLYAYERKSTIDSIGKNISTLSLDEQISYYSSCLIINNNNSLSTQQEQDINWITFKDYK